MSIKKTIYLIIMTLVLCIMTLGYAALQERIDVEVEANIDSTYRVEITRVQEGITNGDARSVSAPSYNDLTATFNVGLTNDTDYITYTIEITNYSTVDVILNNTEITLTNNNMKVTKYGIRNGDIILAGGTANLELKVKLNTEIQNEETGAFTLIFDYSRLKGGTREVVSDLPPGYKECEYIESTGTQYIDTRFKPNQNTRVIVESTAIVNNSDSTSASIFGSRTSFGNGYFGLSFISSYYPGYEGYRFLYNNTFARYPISDDSQFLIRRVIDLNKNKMYIDGTERISFPIANFSCQYNAFVFAHNTYGNPDYYAKAKIYSLKIYDNDELIHVFVPTLDNNDVPCFYDLISGDTFYNAGAGTFLYQLKE